MTVEQVVMSVRTALQRAAAVVRRRGRRRKSVPLRARCLLRGVFPPNLRR